MNKKVKVIISVSIVFLLLSTIAIVMAKYIRNNDSDTGVVAKEFYFTSDYLDVEKTDGTFPEYTLGTGVNDIVFNLNNYVDELQFTQVDIEYEITVTDLSSAVIKELSGTIAKASTKNNVTISIEDLAPGTYIVVAKSTSPYSSTLKGKFTIKPLNESFTYTVSDDIGSPIVQVTISVEDYEGKINIKWPSGVKPDNSDPLLAGAVDCSDYSVLFEKFSEYTFIFFKTDSNTKYETTDFVVTKVS